MSAYHQLHSRSPLPSPPPRPADLAIWLQNHMDELRGLLRLLGGRIGAASFAVYGADGHLGE